jgi:hypothetical protein
MVHLDIWYRFRQSVAANDARLSLRHRHGIVSMQEEFSMLGKLSIMAGVAALLAISASDLAVARGGRAVGGHANVNVHRSGNVNVNRNVNVNVNRRVGVGAGAAVVGAAAVGAAVAAPRYYAPPACGYYPYPPCY